MQYTCITHKRLFTSVLFVIIKKLNYTLLHNVKRLSVLYLSLNRQKKHDYDQTNYKLNIATNVQKAKTLLCKECFAQLLEY